MEKKKGMDKFYTQLNFFLNENRLDGHFFQSFFFENSTVHFSKAGKNRETAHKLEDLRLGFRTSIFFLCRRADRVQKINVLCDVVRMFDNKETCASLCVSRDTLAQLCDWKANIVW